MFKMFLLFLLFIPKIQAESYYSSFKPINESKYKVEEMKKYRFYQNEPIGAYFLEGENPDIYESNDTTNFYLTPYSDWVAAYENLPNREVKTRDVYIYERVKKIRYLYLKTDDLVGVMTEFAARVDNRNVHSTGFCNGCSDGYFMYINDSNYDTNIKLTEFIITLDDYYYPSELEITIASSSSVNIEIAFIEKPNLEAKRLYYKEISNFSGKEVITLKDFETKDAYEDEITKYEEDPNLHLKEKYQEYSYRDKYIYYYHNYKSYYPTYEIDVPNYIKDESNFIIEKSYFEQDEVLIKDNIVITSETYDLADYIKTSLPYETSSNIDISKNGTYKVKYILPFKTIEKEVIVATKNEYLNSLELKLKDKEKELVDVIDLKNQMIEKLESNLKTKDDIISKKVTETLVKKTNVLPVVLITLGVILLLFTIYKSLNKMSK